MCATFGAAQVTSNSWYSDPWKYNCKYDKAQDAIYIAESRWERALCPAKLKTTSCVPGLRHA